MDETIEAPAGTARTTPWQFWAVSIVSLLWNLVGVVDYTMTQTHNAAWLASATAAQRAYIDSFPTLMVALWAFGVWGSFVGSLLLLARSRHAVTAFALSLAGLAGTTIYRWLIAPPPGGSRDIGEIGLMLFIWAVVIALLFYARAMRAKGVLR
ncbi:MAG: hypothetical protein ABIQ98_07725 [Sphingomicrobium sp.]